jgi:hypothetical protein
LYRRLGGAQKPDYAYGEYKHLSLLRGISPQLLVRPVRSLVAIPTVLFQPRLLHLHKHIQYNIILLNLCLHIGACTIDGDSALGPLQLVGVGSIARSTLKMEAAGNTETSTTLSIAKHAKIQQHNGHEFYNRVNQCATLTST